MPIFGPPTANGQKFLSLSWLIHSHRKDEAKSRKMEEKMVWFYTRGKPYIFWDMKKKIVLDSSFTMIRTHFPNFCSNFIHVRKKAYFCLVWAVFYYGGIFWRRCKCWLNLWSWRSRMGRNCGFDIFTIGWLLPGEFPTFFHHQNNGICHLRDKGQTDREKRKRK